MLTTPFFQRLDACQRILLAGAGGGYDLVGGVPLALALRQAGKTVHLASLTFSDPETLPEVRPVPQHSCLFELTARSATRTQYCPEAWLAHWLEHEHGHAAPIWLFRKTGVQPLRKAYRHLVETLDLDAIVLVDGGIDAVLRGDETSIGTPIEDLASLGAVSGLEGPATFLACLGLSAELRDGIPHAQFLSRVAELTRTGAFLGCQSLTLLEPAGQAYASAVEHLARHQEGLRGSHVQRQVLAALRGTFGHQGEDTWVSPLLPLYWFFEARGVADTHLFLRDLEDTETAWDLSLRIDGLRKALPIQPRTTIPL